LTPITNTFAGELCRVTTRTCYEWAESFEKNSRYGVLFHKKWNGRFHERTACRYINRLPVKDGEDVLHVNRVEVTVRNTKTQEILYRNAFVIAKII
jgi:hypothetical protein